MVGVGELIRATRERHGLDRERLARRSGVAVEVIAAIEAGDQPPDTELRDSLVLVMGERLIAGEHGELSCEPVTLPVDAAELEAFGRLSMAERLERSFAWNRFASELAAASLRPVVD